MDDLLSRSESIQSEVSNTRDVVEHTVSNGEVREHWDPSIKFTMTGVKGTTLYTFHSISCDEPSLRVRLILPGNITVPRLGYYSTLSSLLSFNNVPCVRKAILSCNKFYKSHVGFSLYPLRLFSLIHH